MGKFIYCTWSNNFASNLMAVVVIVNCHLLILYKCVLYYKTVVKKLLTLI